MLHPYFLFLPRFSEDEVCLLLELITCPPPPTPAGVKFVSLGLCVLIACNGLISGSPTAEKTAVDWIKWLVKVTWRENS